MYAILIPIWKRHELTREIVAYYNQFKNQYNFDIFVCGSEGKISEELTQGNYYLEYPNQPVGNKNNALMHYAFNDKYSGYTFIGSDDLLSEEILAYYNTLDKSSPICYGFNDIYFFRTKDSKLSYLKNGRTGAGRFYTHRLVSEFIKGGKCHLWDSINSGLDNSAAKNIELKGFQVNNISLSSIEGFMVDIKHDINISSHAIVDVGIPINLEVMARKKAVQEAIEKIATLPKPEKLHPDDKVVKFKSNGTNKHMKVKDAVYDIRYDMAFSFVNRGFGEIID